MVQNPAQDSLQLVDDAEAPTMLAYGGGVDSSGLACGLIERGELPDIALMANVGDELPRTYAYVEMFGEFLRRHGIPFEMVQYRPKHFKHWPKYASLLENLLTNGTLAGATFNKHSCAQKWKIAPQHAWAKNWKPAVETWARGGRVTKLIGFSASPGDVRRKLNADSYASTMYRTIYPLQTWGWDREDAAAATARFGLPPAPKSACWHCIATPPEALHEYPRAILRRIVLLEARAKPRLGPTTGGIWRRERKGMRGTTPRPASMTEYIRQKSLLQSQEIDAIINFAPKALTAFIEIAGARDIENRPELAEWVRLFDAIGEGAFDFDGVEPLYADLRTVAEAQEYAMAA